jgi:indole-3-glycerol phosphate synthase
MELEVTMSINHLSPRLNEIITAKRAALEKRKAKTPIDALRALASMQSRPQPILSDVTDSGDSVVIIGQVKHTLSQNGQMVYDPVATALRYQNKGVNAIALFTDEIVYDKGLDDLMFVSQAVDLPVISQDYVLDDYQIIEARAAGASALMLSATVLEPRQLRTLMSDTQRNRMTAIVQVHNIEELEYALSLSPHVIGISSDDPFTPEIELDLELTRRMRAMIPGYIRVMILENLQTMEDVEIIAGLGVDAMMVSEDLIEVARNIPNLRAAFNRS